MQDTPIQTPSRAFQIGFVLAAGVLLTALFAARYHVIDPDLFAVRDDGVITMSAGRHLVDYGFLGVSPSGPIVEASSSPLQTMIYAAAYALFEVSYDRYAQVQTYVATFVMGAALGVIFQAPKWSSLVAIAGLGLLITFTYPVFLWHGSGMENPITHAVLLLSIAGLVSMVRGARIRAIWAVPLVLTCFARLELLPTIIALLAAFSILWRVRFGALSALWLSLAVLSLCVAIHALRFAYFGDLFPNTADAQGISPFDRLGALLSGSLEPLRIGFSVSLHNTITSGWWIALLSLPIALTLKPHRDSGFLITCVAFVLAMALIAPILLGTPRIDWGRTYSHVAPVAFLIPAWCLYRAIDTGGAKHLTYAVSIVAVSTLWAARNEPYYLGWRVTEFDETRQILKGLADDHNIERALIANPDLGVMSWHKDFNILDLGMLGSPVMAQIHSDPRVADYILDFARPDFIESHRGWTVKYCPDVFLDPRFTERYRPADPGIVLADWCNSPDPAKVIWIRRAIERDSPSAERRFLDQLQAQLSVEAIEQERATCTARSGDCSYITRTVFRFIPELNALGVMDDVIALFPHDPDRAYLTGWSDKDAPGRIVAHVLGQPGDARATNAQTD